jgi:hypothetical protein
VEDGESIWAQRNGGPCEEKGHGEKIATVRENTGEPVYLPTGNRRYPEAEANARLISAAPELLAACKAAADYVLLCEDSYDCGECVCKLTRAAVAKAEAE